MKLYVRLYGAPQLYHVFKGEYVQEVRAIIDHQTEYPEQGTRLRQRD